MFEFEFDQLVVQLPQERLEALEAQLALLVRAEEGDEEAAGFSVPTKEV